MSEGAFSSGLTFPYECRHCGDTVTEPGHASACSANQ